MENYEVNEVSLDDKLGQIIKNDIVDDFKKAFITIGKHQTFFPMAYLNVAESIRNLEIRDSDVIVSSFPKCGTTWMQEMVWMIVNDLDFKGGETELNYRFPFLELSGLNDYKKMKEMNIEFPDCISNTVEYINSQKNPRFIKTHMPFCLLPEQIQNGSKSPKIVYVMRNPKDACISYHHHSKLMSGWRTTLEDFCELFLAGKVMHAPFWEHILEYYEHRNLPNLLIVTYEDMKADIVSVIKRVAKFLEKALTDEQISLLSNHLSFQSMRANKAVNKEAVVEKRRKNNMTKGKGSFLRSGTVGKYKEEMSPEVIEKFNEWNKEHLKGSTFAENYGHLLL